MSAVNNRYWERIALGSGTRLSASARPPRFAMVLELGSGLACRRSRCYVSRRRRRTPFCFLSCSHCLRDSSCNSTINIFVFTAFGLLASSEHHYFFHQGQQVAVISQYSFCSDLAAHPSSYLTRAAISLAHSFSRRRPRLRSRSIFSLIRSRKSICFSWSIVASAVLLPSKRTSSQLPPHRPSGNCSAETTNS